PAWRGITEESAARFLLRFALEHRHGRRQAVFGEEYLAFLSDPAPPFSSRFAAYIFLRDSEARRRFGRDAEAFERWLAADGAATHRLGALAPSEAGVRQTLGVNIIGFADGVLGIGEDVRMMAAAARHAGLRVAIVAVPLGGRNVSTRPHGFEAAVEEGPMFPTSVFCLPPFETARLWLEGGAAFFAARRNIGCWPWELPTLPDEWRMAFDLVDEVWAISPFLAEAWRGMTRKPVIHMPPHVGIGNVEPFERASFGIGANDFLCLSMFDLNSFVDRKNPEGAIAAFRSAFPDAAGRQRLVIKTLNGAARPDAMARLMAAADGDARIRFIDGAWSRSRTLGLIAASNALISLHRAEGFGRVPAEAMLLETPVVATGWSGVAGYLDDTTGWPVPFELRPISPGEYVYGVGGRWAEPDVRTAAEALSRIAAEPAEAALRASRARARVSARHGLEAVGRGLRARLAEIGRASSPSLVVRTA
ncbi:MAG: glycosyltransferase, partial [Beijerinckiaceae bacterium]